MTLVSQTTALQARKDIERRLAAGDIAGALSSSAVLLDSDPGNPELLTLRAAALLADGRADAAVEMLVAPALTSSAPVALKSLLATCQVVAGDRLAAVENFRAVLTDLPDDFVIRLALANCLDLLGDKDAALPEYFRAIHTAQSKGRWLSDASTGPGMRERVRHAIDTVDAGRLALFESVLEPHIKAFGPTSMNRVSEALHLYLGLRQTPPIDPRQQPLFLWMPGLAPTPFFPREQFPWYADLEAATSSIRDEVLAVFDHQRELTPFLDIDDTRIDNDYLGGDPGSRAWDAFFFFRHGERFAANHEACPRTSEMLENLPLARIAEHAPEVLFSVLAPRTHIKPHHGVTNTRVVTHLPLLIPAGDCKLVVGGSEHAWQEGRCITFDDTYLHEAWNRTDDRRVVLIIDTWNPGLVPEECIALKDLIERIGEFNVRAGVR